MHLIYCSKLIVLSSIGLRNIFGVWKLFIHITCFYCHAVRRLTSCREVLNTVILYYVSCFNTSELTTIGHFVDIFHLKTIYAQLYIFQIIISRAGKSTKLMYLSKSTSNPEKSYSSRSKSIPKKLYLKYK